MDRLVAGYMVIFTLEWKGQDKQDIVFQPWLAVMPNSSSIPSSTDPASKKVHSVREKLRIVRVGSSDNQDGTTDTVVSKAVDLDLGSRERRDLATVLTVAGVAESDEASDLVLDGSGELLGETVDDGGALRVATSDDDAVGALCVGQVEEA